jgi:DNA polymerase III epsilon subunit family exonuclease
MANTDERQLDAASIDDVRFAVVDIESTGLDPSRHRILQVAIVLVDRHGNVVDRWSSYVKPRWGRFSRLGPVHIHGIRHRDLAGAPRLADVLTETFRRIEGAVLTAHNLAFDLAFLEAEAKRTGCEVPSGHRLCTLELSRRLDPARERRHRLADLCARHGIEVVRPHDALADADATALVIPFLLDANGVESLDQLLAVTTS